MSRAPRAVTALAGMLLGGMLFSAWADEPGGITHASGAGQSGAEIYLHVCQGCHMPDAQGASGAGHYPRLARDDTLKGRLGELVAASVVLNGRNGMPSFGMPANFVPDTNVPVLTDAQIAAVVNYVRSHFGNDYPQKVTAAQVRALRHPVSVAQF